jgi:hypothetical protein
MTPFVVTAYSTVAACSKELATAQFYFAFGSVGQRGISLNVIKEAMIDRLCTKHFYTYLDNVLGFSIKRSTIVPWQL